MMNIMKTIGNAILKALGMAFKGICFYLIGSFILAMLLQMMGIISMSVYTI